MDIEIRPINLPSPTDFKAPALALDHLTWLKRESVKHNLTTVPEGDWLVRHVMDSLVPAIAGWEIGARFLDLGTGAGFPGIPLAAQFPKATFTLLEKKKKTVRILSEFLEGASLSSRGEAVSERAETLARDTDHRGKYDVVTVRALAALPVLVELGIPLLKTGGELWLWKSDLSELQKSENAFKELRATVLRAIRYRLSDEENDRYLIAIKKEGEISEKYPRREGLPERRPL